MMASCIAKRNLKRSNVLKLDLSLYRAFLRMSLQFRPSQTFFDIQIILPGIIKTELEKLFGAAMVDWQVAIAEPLQVDGVTPEGFKTSGNDDYARYTSDMKKVIKAFEKSGRKKRHTLYLFFVSATQGDRSGYMPLAGEYGFIFNFGSNTNVIGHVQ